MAGPPFRRVVRSPPRKVYEANPDPTSASGQARQPSSGLEITVDHSWLLPPAQVSNARATRLSE